MANKTKIAEPKLPAWKPLKLAPGSVEVIQVVYVYPHVTNLRGEWVVMISGIRENTAEKGELQSWVLPGRNERHATEKLEEFKASMADGNGSFRIIQQH